MQKKLLCQNGQIRKSHSDCSNCNELLKEGHQCWEHCPSSNHSCSSRWSKEFVRSPHPRHSPSRPGTPPLPRPKVGRNMVTSGGPVRSCYRYRNGADVLLPPVTGSSDGLFSVCLASGNQRRSCYRSGNEPLLPFPKKTLRPALTAAPPSPIHLQDKRGPASAQQTSPIALPSDRREFLLALTELPLHSILATAPRRSYPLLLAPHGSSSRMMISVRGPKCADVATTWFNKAAVYESEVGADPYLPHGGLGTWAPWSCNQQTLSLHAGQV